MKKKIFPILFIMTMLTSIIHAQTATDELDPIKSHFNVASIGYAMGGQKNGVYLFTANEFLGSQHFGLGIGAFMPIYAIPSQIAVTASGIQVQNNWGMNLEFGLGWHLADKTSRFILWQHLAPILLFEGYITPENALLPGGGGDLIYLFSWGILIRQMLSLYITDHFGFTVTFGLGMVVESLLELQNGEKVDKGTYDVKQYPYLYIDTNIGIVFRY